jgi:murein DD-endopeptidase MepM/ murein hydrolase activator NlpD
MPKLFYPIDKVFVTQKFGERPAAYKKYGMSGHNGVDLRTRFVDSPLAHRYCTAAAAGRISEVGTDAKAGYGIFVRIDHPDGSQTIYGHFSKVYVKVGQSVLALQRIGLTGNTGDSTGPHLHFGYRPPGWQKKYGNGFKGYEDPLPLMSLAPGQKFC